MSKAKYLFIDDEKDPSTEAIIDGFNDTAVVEVVYCEPKKFEDRAAAAALQRLCTPDDVSTAIISCILMRGMTAQNLVIDAGQTAGSPSSLYEQERDDANLKRRLNAFSVPQTLAPGSGK
ncbi:MAG: hypothetical protein HGA87_05295 [Desulfobulbaceae bacterium]|nr:hypothetical protein [Desulfobulbaceae bacterium]